MSTPSRCPVCDVRKARRACPALAGPICAMCCGTKRLVEIACPPGCAYLSSARQHPPAALQKRQEREARFLASVAHGLTEPQYRLFLFLQMTVTRYAPDSIPPLRDQDVADAARALADTAETSSRGIIYEHPTSSLPAQRLAAALKAAVETLRQNGREPRSSDLAMALRCTERGAANAERALGGERAYLRLLEEVFRAGPGTAAEDGERAGDARRSGLIIP